MDNKIPSVLLLALLFAVAGCGSLGDRDGEGDVFDQVDYGDEEDVETDNFDYDANYENDQSNLNVDDETVGEQLMESKLAVDAAKCIGCGKCVRSASEYFAMQSGKAVVVTQEDIDVSVVEKSINNCPVNAISIV